MSQVAALHKELFSDFHRPAAPLDEPSYTDGVSRQVLGRYVRKAVDGLKTYYKKLDESPTFRNATVSLGRLPIYVSRLTGRIKGVIHGEYNPDTHNVTINADSVELPIPDSEVKRQLRQYNMTEMPENVVTHELGHHAQKETGALMRYIKKLRIPFFYKIPIEGGNTVVTEAVTGNPQTTYPEEQGFFRKLINRYGNKKAVLGDVPIGLTPQPAPAYAFASRRLAYAR